MKENIKVWCFIVLLPFFIAVGFDLYSNYLSSADQKARLEAFEIDPKAFQSSDFGYVLLKHAPDQYYMAKDMIGEPTWGTWIDPILRLYTYVVALLPATLFFIWIFVSRMFDAGPLAVGAVSKNGKGRSEGKKDIQFKYKRR